MQRFLVSVLFTACMLQATRAEAAPPPNACSILSGSEADALVGMPLGEIARHETPPSGENGNDQQGSCGYFPKGYHIENADGPPAGGLLLELHTLASAQAARRFYDGVLDMHKQMPSPGAELSLLKGLGAGAYALRTVLAGSPSRIVTVTFFKGSTVASVQVWKNAAPVDAIARAAAAKVVARLP